MINCINNIPPIPNMGCAVKYGQVQKIAFTKLGNSFTKDNPITEIKSWEDFLVANDSTKIVVTPYVEMPNAEGGDERTFGGGNETLDGIEMVMGINPTKMSFALRYYPQNIIVALKALTKVKDLGVYLLNGSGGVIALEDGDEYKPIPIRSLFVGDLILYGLSQPDKNIMSFWFKANYSDKLRLIQPKFNPLNDLTNMDVHIGDGSFSKAFNVSFDI